MRLFSWLFATKKPAEPTRPATVLHGAELRVLWLAVRQRKLVEMEFPVLLAISAFAFCGEVMINLHGTDPLEKLAREVLGAPPDGESPQ